jgi:hypothetical protein
MMKTLCFNIDEVMTDDAYYDFAFYCFYILKTGHDFCGRILAQMCCEYGMASFVGSIKWSIIENSSPLWYSEQ